jgi:hypothetical protein
MLPGCCCEPDLGWLPVRLLVVLPVTLPVTLPLALPDLTRPLCLQAPLDNQPFGSMPDSKPAAGNEVRGGTSAWLMDSVGAPLLLLLLLVSLFTGDGDCDGTAVLLRDNNLPAGVGLSPAQALPLYSRAAGTPGALCACRGVTEATALRGASSSRLT